MKDIRGHSSYGKNAAKCAMESVGGMCWIWIQLQSWFNIYRI